MDYERCVYITIGLLGSGKSTWAKRFAKNRPNVKIVCPDSFRTMLNGEYKYLAELDDVITQSTYDTAFNLLWAGYDVIVDCGNLTNAPDRRKKWLELPARHIAVVFPVRDRDWHIGNRGKDPHCEADWGAIWDRERAAYEPVNNADYDEVALIN